MSQVAEAVLVRSVPPSARHALTASGRKRGKTCLYWARRDLVLPPPTDTAGAALGSGFHESADEDVSEDVFRDGWRAGVDLAAIADKWDLSPAQTEQLEAMHAAWREWWPSFAGNAAWRTEVPFAFDIATGRARELPSNGQRDYSCCSPTEVPGTVDGVGFEYQLGGLTVLDLKTGRPPKRVADYIDQLSHGALCAARVQGVDRVRVVIAHVTTMGVEVDAAELDAFDLDAAAAELRSEVARIPTAEPRPGMHCKELFCPARAVCPATQDALAHVAPAVLPDRVRRLPLVGPLTENEQAAMLLEGLPLLEAWIEERKRAVKAYADEHQGVRLSDGRVYAGWPAKSTSLRLDVRGAEDALREVLGDHTGDAVTRSLTQTGIERAARRLARQRGDITRIKAAALDALKRRGAVKVSAFKKYEARDGSSG